MPCNQGACALCVYKYQQVIISKEERSLKESHAGRITIEIKFFFNKKKVFFFSFFHLELSEKDVHQRAQEADSGQERLICAETEIIEVWDCRLGRHGYSLLSWKREFINKVPVYQLISHLKEWGCCGDRLTVTLKIILYRHESVTAGLIYRQITVQYYT